MNKFTKIFSLVGFALLASSLSSCLHGDADEYEEWRLTNDAYIAALDTTQYHLVSPAWAPQNSVYIKWHNDRRLTASNLVAISTSTVDIKYELEDINGTKLGNSYSVASGDSVYRSTPNQNILGMWIAMTTMHVGDSATLVIPYPSGYGQQITGTIKPYSNLIYHVKIKAVKAFERPFE